MTDNMRIWRAVEKTNPAHTKTVNQRGGFTAISANYQIMRATETFGPVGIGWGYTAGDPIFHDTLCFVPVTLWHGDRANTFGPMLGCEEWKDKNGRVDSDVSKKATTDAITKLLSQLGFNADVFMGLYDDQKYVAQMKREFAEKAPAAANQDDKCAMIVNLAQAAGVTIQTIVESYNVSSLEELSAEKIEAVIKRLNLTIKDKKEAA